MALGPELRFLDRARVLCEGRSYVFFGGNDDHRLANHPEVLRAAQEASESEGLSAAESRVTTSNHPLHARLEAKAAAFLSVEESALCADGYLSDTVALETLSREFQRLFLDGGAHASLRVPVDGLPGGRVHVFRHSDPENLRKELVTHLRPRERPLILTDGVESGDGELPPLSAYWEAVRNEGGMLLVDDAHGMGTTGLTGQGSPGEAHLPPEAFLQTGTFAKAFGVFGGIVAGRAGLSKKVVECGRTFIGATPMPPPLAAAALRSIEILQARPEMISELRARTFRVRERICALGLPPALPRRPSFP